LTIFERDGWRCGSCGIDTPKELIGTMATNAPTLEHLYPVSLGGAHSYKNCGLSCRACNSNKRNKIEMEPRLAGVTDFSPYKRAKFTAQKQDEKQMLCACGCGEYFAPIRKNKSGCKHGHWHMSEARQEQDYANYGTEPMRPYVPLEVDPKSRLGKKLATMRLRQASQQARQVKHLEARRRTAKPVDTPLPLPKKSTHPSAKLRTAPHTALSRSGLCVSDYVKAVLACSPCVHAPCAVI